MRSDAVALMGVYGAAALAVLLWGTSPVGTKFALDEVSPLGVMAIRTIAGGLAGLALTASLGIKLPPTGKEIAQVALAGFCGMVAFPTLFSLGMQSTSGLHGAMILACMPVTTSAIAFASKKRLPPALWWAGCTLALGGEVLLVLRSDGFANDDATLAGDLLVFSSTLFACTGYVIGGNLQKSGYPARGVTFWGAGISACLLLPLAPWLLGPINPAVWRASTWVALAYLAFGVTILGYIFWYWALGRGGVGRISLMQFLQPVSGLTLSAALLGEQIDNSVILASILVIGGTIVATTGS